MTDFEVHLSLGGVTRKIGLARSNRARGKETVVFEPGHSSVWVSDTIVSRTGRQLVASADFVADDGGPVLLDRRAMVVTVLGQRTVVEIAGCPAP